MYAVDKGHTETVLALIENGTDVNVKNKVCNWFDT